MIWLYDIETRDLWPWNHIRALRIGISSLLLHHLIWYHVATITSRSDTRGISSPTVQVVERLDGCDPYFRRSITPTLRFKCQDIIRFPILPTKHNPQALRTGGEIHQYFFGWIDTSRIDVVGRRHLSIDNYVHTHIVRRTIFAPRRGIICVCYLFAEYEHYIFDIWQKTTHFC